MQRENERWLAENIGRRVYNVRLRKTGMTHVRLSELSGVSVGTISRIERGKSRPYADILARLADALGTTAGALLGEVAK